MNRDVIITRSKGITLLLAGTLATTIWQEGCTYDELQPPAPPRDSRIVGARQLRDDQDQDNNTYVPGFGYYHSAYHSWYPYPFNWYYPDYGYYYGGEWNDGPYKGSVPPRSRPSAESISEVHEFIRTGSKPGAWRNGSFKSTFGRFMRGVSRGGFGSGFHGFHS